MKAQFGVEGFEGQGTRGWLSLRTAAAARSSPVRFVRGHAALPSNLKEPLLLLDSVYEVVVLQLLLLLLLIQVAV